MGGAEHRETVPGERTHEVAQDARARHVEATERLVEQEHLGFLRQCPGEQHPLLLPARQGGEGAVGEVLGPHPGERPGHRVATSGGAAAQASTEPVPPGGDDVGGGHRHLDAGRASLWHVRHLHP